MRPQSYTYSIPAGVLNKDFGIKRGFQRVSAKAFMIGNQCKRTANLTMEKPRS